jgi:hypothetical protein
VIRRPYETRARPRLDPLIKRERGRRLRARRRSRSPDLLRPWQILGRAGVFENRIAHAVEDVDLSAQPVGKGQPKDAVADDLSCGDIGGRPFISRALIQKCLTGLSAILVASMKDDWNLGYEDDTNAILTLF